MNSANMVINMIHSKFLDQRKFDVSEHGDVTLLSSLRELLWAHSIAGLTVHVRRVLDWLPSNRWLASSVMYESDSPPLVSVVAA
jgi:hypothetical protein